MVARLQLISVHLCSFSQIPEPLVLEREAEGKEEKGYGEGEQEGSQETSCRVLSGEESEVRQIASSTCRTSEYMTVEVLKL